jgi:hypothetical protein
MEGPEQQQREQAEMEQIADDHVIGRAAEESAMRHHMQEDRLDAAADRRFSRHRAVAANPHQ